MNVRMLCAVALAAALVVPSGARAADATMLLQGPGSTTFYSAELGNLTCAANANIAFRIAGADFQLAEWWSQPAPNPSGNVERQASCALNQTLTVFEADNATPVVRQCVPPQSVMFVSIDGVGVGMGPFTLSGNGSATTPYVMQYGTTACTGERLLDRITLRTAPPMSYKHEYFINNVLRIKSTATPTRTA
jgi:hypothetical protein